jgi:carboxymethylenebutenolidase
MTSSGSIERRCLRAAIVMLIAVAGTAAAADTRSSVAGVIGTMHSQPDGFLAAPPSGSGPGVLVLHAWWGLNDTIKNVCTRLAEAGFVAFAPDLYRGKVATTVAQAEALAEALDADHRRAEADVGEAVAFLAGRTSQRAVAVLGFSLGAFYALQISAADPEQVRAVVLFYGTGPVDASKSRARYLGHFADRDQFEPLSNVESLKQSLERAGRPVRFYVYPGTGHWFFERDRSDAYNAAAADLAWQRTLEFLHGHGANADP